MLKENHHLCTELKSLQKQCVLHQQAVKGSSDGMLTAGIIETSINQFFFFFADNAQLRETIEKLHAILSKRCNFEGKYLTQVSFPGSCV